MTVEQKLIEQIKAWNDYACKNDEPLYSTNLKQFIDEVMPCGTLYKTTSLYSSCKYYIDIEGVSPVELKRRNQTIREFGTNDYPLDIPFKVWYYNINTRNL